MIKTAGDDGVVLDSDVLQRPPVQTVADGRHPEDVRRAQQR